MNILQALDDPKVFADHFRGDTWNVWRVFLAALFALPMTPEQLALYSQAHRTQHATDTAAARGVVGVRQTCRKIFILACVAIFIACFRDWRPLLGAR